MYGNPMLRKRDCGCRETPARSRRMRKIAERVAPRPVRGDIEPVTVSGGQGSKCKPFIKIEKDAEAFAACNALADEIGELNDPKKMVLLIEEICGDEVNEVFGIVMLDLHCRFKGNAETGRGEPTSVMAPIGPTFQVAVANGAHTICLYHVHPSGVEAQPSKADEETTKAFVEAGDVLGIPVIDHIILGGDSRNRSYYSFLEDQAL